MKEKDTNVCPRGLVPFYIIRYYIKWFKTSWTHSKLDYHNHNISTYTVCRISLPFYVEKRYLNVDKISLTYSMLFSETINLNCLWFFKT